MLPTPLRACLLAMASLLAAAGCSGGNDYEQALAAAAGGLPSVTTPELERYPSRRSLKLRVAEQRVGLGRFWALARDCGLGALVGNRNSAMGRVQADSQRLAYEQVFLARAGDCRARRELDDELAAALDQVLADKRRDLPALFWNAVVAGPEAEDLFSLSAGGPLGAEQRHTLQERNHQAVGYLAWFRSRLGDPDWQPRSSELEAALASLGAAGYGGRLLATAQARGRVLRQATQVLGGLECGDLKDLAPAAARAQERSAAVLAAGRTLAADFDRLAGPAAPAAYQDPAGGQALARYRSRYLNLETGLWAWLEQARRDHRRAWSQARRRCPGLEPPFT